MLAGSGGSASFAQEVAVGARGQRLGEDSGCGARRHGGPRDLPEGGGARGAGVNRSGQVGREGGADRRGVTSCGASGAFGAGRPIGEVGSGVTQTGGAGGRTMGVRTGVEFVMAIENDTRSSPAPRSRTTSSDR